MYTINFLLTIDWKIRMQLKNNKINIELLQLMQIKLHLLDKINFNSSKKS